MSDSHSVCDCPLCPLLEANVQLCDGRVKQLNKSSYVFGGLNEFSHLRRYFATLIILLQEKNRKLKVGQYMTSERKPSYSEKGFTYCIDKISKNEYKVCFHTIPQIPRPVPITEDDFKIADTPTVVGDK